jgi:hypothetical protein
VDHLVEHALDQPRWSRRGEVDDRAGDRGDRDAVDRGAVLGPQRGAGVGADPGLRAPRRTAREHDVDPGRVASPQVVHGRGRHDAERPLRARRPGRSQPVPCARQQRVSDGVDAAVERVQAPAVEPVPDLPWRQPRRQQLAPGQHAVLRGGELGDSRVDAIVIEKGTHRVH